MIIRRRTYGLEYNWRDKWLFVSAPRYIYAEPGGVFVLFYIQPPCQIMWHVAGKDFQGWDIVGAFKFWRRNRQSMAA